DNMAACFSGSVSNNMPSESWNIPSGICWLDQLPLVNTYDAYSAFMFALPIRALEKYRVNGATVFWLQEMLVSLESKIWIAPKSSKADSIRFFVVGVIWL